jgi:hypothetical protein
VLRKEPYLIFAVITLSRLRRSLALFLALVVAAGAVAGDVVTATGVGLFLLVLACMDPKPAWKWFYDPPGDVDSGRAGGRFVFWRRGDGTSPPRNRPRSLA